MAKRKRRAEEEERELTRKEIRLRARDRERNRRLYIGIGIALGLALVLVIVGAVLQFAVRPNRAIASVGEDSIVTQDFWKRIRFEKWQLQNQLFQMQQLEQQFGQGVFGNQISQLQNALSNPVALSNQVLDQMIDEKVVAQQAATRGITVSDQEVDEALRKEIANGRGAVTAPQATETAEAGTQATATAASWTPTPAPTIDVSSTITATATAVPTPEPLPTSAILSDTGYTEGLNVLTENLSTAGGISLEDYREIIRSRLLAEKLKEIIDEEKVAPTEEQVHARHILLRIHEPTPTPTTTVTSTVTSPITASIPLTSLAGLTATESVTSATDMTATESITNAAEVTATDDVTASADITNAAEVTTTDDVTSTIAVTTTEELTDTAVLTGTTPLSSTAGTTETLITDPNLPRNDEQTRALAEALHQRILNGEDFATLAREFSEDPSSGPNGGDLGWFGHGRMVAPFEEAAFSLPLNQVSEPIKSDFGYHLIEVLEKDANRPKEQAQLDQERNEAYQTWLTEQKTAITIEKPDADELPSLLPSDFTG